MKHLAIISAIAFFILPTLTQADEAQLKLEVQRLQKQTSELQAQLARIQTQLVKQPSPHKPKSVVVPNGQTTINKAKKVKVSSRKKIVKKRVVKKPQMNSPFHTSAITINAPDADPESLEFYPTALVADNHVLTYIAGTPVVASPYLGSRPAFDGSDYIVNISSINRDIRLMQQRRSLYRAYEKIGYPPPNSPIIALSGKAEPLGTIGRPYFGDVRGDWNLGSNELDAAAILNDKVEAYMGIAYDAAPPALGGQRVSNSAFGLNMGFVNIGDLDESPFYLTAGQLFAPFGRYSSSMVSAPLPMRLTRTKARPIILGYKSQTESGFFGALYGFRSDTTLGNSAVGGVNLGYILDVYDATSEIGASFISSIDDAGGMQVTGSAPGTTFGGFASPTNGSENVHKVPGAGVHASISYDRYNLTTEWVTSLGRYHVDDLSFNGVGAQPQAAQIEGGITFMAFNRPSSVALGYQWSKDTLALNMPEHRISGVFNISIWKDTVESLEYRHDIDFGKNQYANGISAPGYTKAHTVGSGGSADTLIAQIGVYF
jgi:hypothetical protein